MSLVLELMQTLLVAIEGYVANAGLDPFSEMYVVTGKPSHECCDAVIVYAENIGIAAIGARLPNSNTLRVQNAAVPSAVITINILECVATVSDQGQFPSLADYAADAQLVYNRGSAIYSGLLCDITAKTLWTPELIGQTTGEVILSKLSWPAPAGGCLAGSITITTQMQGF